MDASKSDRTCTVAVGKRHVGCGMSIDGVIETQLSYKRSSHGLWQVVQTVHIPPQSP